MRHSVLTFAAAFENFLSEFKTSPEKQIIDTLSNLDIDADDLSDEYDFLDDDDEGQNRRQREKARKRLPQHKYKEVLQKLADRQADEIVIDLDDLATVSATPPPRCRKHLTRH